MKRSGGKYLGNALHCVLISFVLYMMFPMAAIAEQLEEEKNFLLMYFKEDELQVVSSTRSIKSISRVAENMTVVTAADIERMNAHTLAEVLNTVNGVQVWFSPTTPGNVASILIQGSDQRHVLVLIDGVIQNNLFSNIAVVGTIPVQMIDKIEIVKGPASSAWGSALGGVINVITKNPPDSGIRGMVSASYGTRDTEDYRAEIRGRKGDLGLYLTGGGIHSDGLRFGSSVINNSLYSKVTYAIALSTNIQATGFYLNSHKQRGDFREFDEMDKDKAEQYFGTISLSSRLASNLVLDLSAYAQRLRNRTLFNTLSTSELIAIGLANEKRFESAAKVTWKLNPHTIVAGIDYNHGTYRAVDLLDGKQTLKRWALFVNDSITLGDFAFTPGLRYEDTNTNGHFLSPSLGATYMLTKRTILRATVARGFNIPGLGDTFSTAAGGFPNPDLKVEKVMSYQVGAESGELKYVWAKISIFRHDIKDVLAVIDSDGDSFVDKTVNAGRQRRQGFEAEIRTMPVYNTALAVGTTYILAKDRDTNEVIQRIPKFTYDISVSYDDQNTFNALLKGRYVWWNSEADINSKYSNFVFDLNMIKTLYKHQDQKVEVFLSAHNLLNANQYMGYFYRNAGRWAEAGLRYKF